MNELELRNICTEHLEQLCRRDEIINYRIQCDKENNPPNMVGTKWEIYIEPSRGLGVRLYTILWVNSAEVDIEDIGHVPQFESLIIELRNEKIEEILN